MPLITRLLETSLYIDDLDRSAGFYQDLFGFETLLRDDRMCALSVADSSVLLLFKKGGSSTPSPVPGGIIPPHDADGRAHMAFAIPAESLNDWEAALEKRGLAIESRVLPERGGTSLYFRDPDGHLIELATPGIWTIY